VPCYKKIAIAILKNDYALKYLGFEPPKSEAYNTLKRIEISQRPNFKPIQLKLF
jgi:predicted phosphoadenosine phosphosulfate sulfurtransferase